MSAIPSTSPIARRARAAARPVRSRLRDADATLQRLLVAHSIAVLRMSVGAVFLAFGVLKFFPGVSPAQDLVERTTHLLTFGLVPGGVALVCVATLESAIGLCLLSGRAVRGAVYLLAIALVGILSPLLLLPGRLFDGPHGAPTIEGQYVIKDVVFVGAALVIAAAARGAHLEHRPQ